MNATKDIRKMGGTTTETLTIKTSVMHQINLKFVVSILISVIRIMIMGIRHGDTIIIIITIMIIMSTIIMTIIILCSHSHRLSDLGGTLVVQEATAKMLVMLTMGQLVLLAIFKGLQPQLVVLPAIFKVLQPQLVVIPVIFKALQRYPT